MNQNNQIKHSKQNFNCLMMALLFTLFIVWNAQVSAKEIEISLTAHGEHIKFDQEKVEIDFSKKLKIKFVNKATEGSGILHNILLTKKENEAKLIEMIQKLEYDSKKISELPYVMAMTKDLDPGEVESVTLTLDTAESLSYLCSMPGHSDMLGMKGTIEFK